MVKCFAELQAKGYNVPDYPANPKDAEDEAIKPNYSKVLRSVNGATKVLKEGLKLQKGNVIGQAEHRASSLMP